MAGLKALYSHNLNGSIGLKLLMKVSILEWDASANAQDLNAFQSSSALLGQNTRIDDYTFYQGQDSAQGDISYLPGKSAQELKTLCNRDVACIGFNTNGWIKSSLQTRSKWYRWSDAANQGIYVKAGSYMYHPGLDSNLGDTVHLPGLEVNELKAYCDSDSSCVGFNTNGWIKSSLQPRSEWRSWSISAEQGLYVKYRYPTVKDVSSYEKSDDLNVMTSISA